MDRRCKDIRWAINLTDDGNKAQPGQAVLAVAMDIRDELKQLNRLLSCPNFVAIPTTLREISANTKRPRRKLKK